MLAKAVIARREKNATNGVNGITNGINGITNGFYANGVYTNGVNGTH